MRSAGALTKRSQNKHSNHRLYMIAEYDDGAFKRPWLRGSLVADGFF